MARAAAKRNRGAQQAARPAPDRARARKKQQKSIEDQLFFNRIRGHAKWVFVLLAVVFGASFVFLGVGSGQSGLGDVFQNVFGGSSGPSIKSLQGKVAENPRSQTAVIDLAQALDRDGRTDEAVATYRAYLQLKPKDVDVLNNLALLYQTKAGTAANDANTALRDVSLAAPGAQFRPGSGVLGEAIALQIDPLAQAASTQAEAAYQEALNRYRGANRDALGIYSRLSKLQPKESGALLRYAQAAEGANNLPLAIRLYQRFVKNFPKDPLAADAKTRIKLLEKQVKNSASSLSAGNPG